jgi:serine/threonine protein phosphatase PrpC
VTAMAHQTGLQWAGATNVGAVRTNNEDRYLARDDAGLWIVADGMGGHRGGEIASQIACDEIARRFESPTTRGLIDAIEAANAAVYQVGEEDPDLAGMGTTVVALAVVDEGGQEELAVANVGDSRIYRLTGGELEQLTEDHSLVADMVREGSLSAEEAASHPQRNILTRVLGVYEDVSIDVVTVTPRHGDRFLLCSDGLFNEIPEDRIASVLRRLSDPGEAADELVRGAVEAGGRDNVTVVLVDVVSDGRDPRAMADTTTRLAGPEGGVGAGDTAPHEALAPYSGGAYATEDDTGTATTADDRVRRARRRRVFRDPEDAVTARAADGDPGDELDDGAPRHRSTSTRPRRMTWRVVLFTFLLLAVVGGAFATIQWYGRSAYFVGFAGDDVAIFRGRPGGVLWIDPELVERTELSRADVPADSVAAIQAGKEEPKRSGAEAYVANLVERVEEREAEARRRTTTTTTAPSTTVPTVPRPPAPGATTGAATAGAVPPATVTFGPAPTSPAAWSGATAAGT